MHDTYVGEDFIISAPGFDNNRLNIFNGQRCRLIGFKINYKVIPDTEAEILKLKPGIYETIGYPVVTLPNGVVTPVSLQDLKPIGYSFNDLSNAKNINYQAAKNKFKFIKSIEPFYHGIGDVVLCSKKPNTACLILDFQVEKDMTPSVLLMPENTEGVLSNELITCRFDEIYSSLIKASNIGAQW